MLYCYLGRLTVLERWLPYTVTILDRFHCSCNVPSLPSPPIPFLPLPSSSSSLSLPADPHGRTASFLLAVTVPSSILFLAVIGLMGLGHTSQTAIFYFGYTAAAVLQVGGVAMLVVTGRGGGDVGGYR